MAHSKYKDLGQSVYFRQIKQKLTIKKKKKNKNLNKIIHKILKDIKMHSLQISYRNNNIISKNKVHSVY